ncbi:TetR/AcrR family transcriptional regulator, partial [Aneurinibacillus sp. REN35]
RYTRSHAARIRAVLQRHASVRASFRDCFERLSEEAEPSRPSRGCFCINTIVELAPRDEKFEVLTREHQMYLAVLFQ